MSRTGGSECDRGAYHIVIALVGVMIVFLSTFFNQGYADHGQEISLAVTSVDIIKIPSESGANRIHIFLNYTLKDPTVKNQTINSVMKIYDNDGVLLKTSSSKQGFRINQSGIHRHSTTVANTTAPNMKAIIQFTDMTKIAPLSNSVDVGLDLGRARNEISVFPGKSS